MTANSGTCGYPKILSPKGVLDRYCYGADAKNEALLASCFAPDAYYEANTGEGQKLRANGNRAIAKLICESVSRFASTLHFVGNSNIELSGDKAKCDVFGLAIVALYAVGDISGRVLVRGVRYRDEMAEFDGGWVITQRIHHSLWQFDQQSVPPYLPPMRGGGMAMT